MIVFFHILKMDQKPSLSAIQQGEVVGVGDCEGASVDLQSCFASSPVIIFYLIGCLKKKT